ncbi:hypothetical protein PR048_019509 [Dryococelus australis]|uniref:HAT C-terminal dimerisation domain-containing protein n=1 Tax=Dryococelus australis TaxID=614101 RepID=A0ABQ9H3N3_9NEOP|nr:hypothetical protein PR048_019509 [Dryococelus australis]
MSWEVPADLLLDEWKLLQREEGTSTASMPVDVDWSQFMELKDEWSTGPKYSTVAKIVKAALSLSHGSADVERGFLSSCRTLTTYRDWKSKRTLNVLMTVKGVLKN